MSGGLLKRNAGIGKDEASGMREFESQPRGYASLMPSVPVNNSSGRRGYGRKRFARIPRLPPQLQAKIARDDAG